MKQCRIQKTFKMQESECPLPPKIEHLIAIEN